MSTTTHKQGSMTLPQTHILTQAEYHALIHGFEKVVKFNPSSVIMQDSKLISFIETRRAVIQADYTPLLKQPMTMALALDKSVIKQAKAIRGKGDVHVRLQGRQWHFLGDHTHMSFRAIPMHEAPFFTMPAISWLGTTLSGYDSKDLSAYIGRIGKGNEAVKLVVYGDQLEQIRINGRGSYTFTAGMAERLAKRRPDVELLSQVAFRFIGPKQTLRLGKLNDQYFLCATTPIDMSVDLVVTELLHAVPGR